MKISLPGPQSSVIQIPLGIFSGKEQERTI